MTINKSNCGMYVALPADVSEFSDLVIDSSEVSLAKAIRMLEARTPVHAAMLVLDALTHPHRTIDAGNTTYALEVALGLERN